jgi:hypothetical protein
LFPKNYKVEFENDFVRVIRVKYDAREKTAMHDHSDDPVLIVPLTDSHVRFTVPDGKVIESKRKTGEALWFEGASRIPQHAVENAADQPFEQLRIEIKARPVTAPKAR